MQVEDGCVEPMTRGNSDFRGRPMSSSRLLQDNNDDADDLLVKELSYCMLLGTHPNLFRNLPLDISHTDASTFAWLGFQFVEHHYAELILRFSETALRKLCVSSATELI